MKKIIKIFMLIGLLSNNALSMKRSLEAGQPTMDQIDEILLLAASQEYNKIVKQENKIEWQKAQKFIRNHDFSKNNHVPVEPVADIVVSHIKPKITKQIIKYSCDNGECRFSTTREAYMKSHQKMHEEMRNKKVYKCDTCDYLNDRSNDMEIHEATHNKEKKYVCNLCPTQFTTQRSKERHEKNQH